MKNNNHVFPGTAWDIHNAVAGSDPLKGSLSIAYSDFEYLRSRTGSVTPVFSHNLNIDPKFSTSGFLYRLTEASKCIDAGSNAAPHMPKIDLAERSTAPGRGPQWHSDHEHGCLRKSDQKGPSAARDPSASRIVLQ